MKSLKYNDTAIIIPAYNEHENIRKLIIEIRKKFHSLILVIDDSSSLKTKLIIKNIHDNNIIHVHRKEKMGRGSAVLFGFKKVFNNFKNIKYFIEMDADLSHHPRELPDKIKIFLQRRLDLLVSSRYLKNSQIKNWPFRRKVLSKISNILAKLVIQAPVHDFTNGYRIYSKRAIALILDKCAHSRNDFILLSEIILTLNENKLKISEKPTIFIDREKGKSNVNFKLIFNSFIGLFRLMFFKKKYI